MIGRPADAKIQVETPEATSALTTPEAEASGAAGPTVGPEASPTALPPSSPMPSATSTVVPTASPTATATPLPSFYEGPVVYGESYNGRPLVFYRLGYGESARAIIGGIHGGYEWNTVEFVSDTLDYLLDNRHVIPDDVTLYVIPNMNPDGYAAGTDPVVARMNGNLVDLNRNWDYNHQITATHGTRPVRAGSAPFSEPETRYTRNLILDKDIEAVIFYHSALGVVFSGADRQSSATYELTELLSEVTGYRHQTEGMPGQITTGDAIDWASTVGIAGAEVELTTHALIGEEEFQRNLDGVRAFLNWTVPQPDEPPAPSDLETGEFQYITHTVKAGETLLGIALDYDVDMDLLQDLNDIDDEDAIWEGQELTIPVMVE
jgi:hypothetical protein